MLVVLWSATVTLFFISYGLMMNNVHAIKLTSLRIQVNDYSKLTVLGSHCNHCRAVPLVDIRQSQDYQEANYTVGRGCRDYRALTAAHTVRVSRQDTRLPRSSWDQHG